MKSKAFFNDPTLIVDHMCKSLAAQNPTLRYDSANKVLYRPVGQDETKVSLISGGGSGHEPAHAGYVGEGMLDAAVCGKVFASPNFDQIISAFDRVATPRGILVIVKNYTGDKLNFGLAAETYQAQTGIPTHIVTIADDVSVPYSRGKLVGRRGLAGAVLVHKISGAAAASGLGLSEVAKVAQHVSDNMATIGCSLDYANLPGGADQPSIPENAIELGMGIHNEPGAQRISPQPSIEQLVSNMLKLLLNENDPEHGFLKFQGVPQNKSELVLMVNNLGGLSVLELQAIANVTLECLKAEYNITPIRIYVNTYLTALDAPGFNITIANLTPKIFDSDINLLSLLDEPVEIGSWATSQPLRNAAVAEAAPENKRARSPKLNKEIMCTFHLPMSFMSVRSLIFQNYIGDQRVFLKILENILAQVTTDEPKLTEYDTLMGDGDCGTTLLAGAKAAHAISEQGEETLASLSKGLMKVASAVRSGMGGTSGALYGIFLNSFVSGVQRNHEEFKEVNIQLFAKSATQALETLKGYTNARENSRTLMDALIPFVNELSKAVFTEKENASNALHKALKAAEDGAEATKWMKSTFGRSTYVGASEEGDDNPTKGIPDPGACGIVAIATAIQSVFQTQN
ncbi:dihydroxyacetone kinase [Penicillium argentinense]|uniref:Dihydroxyacetone kinase n=1 Tax=Penicillium argentinense TaxID=1131581 RepID=A0A9W9FEJ3_9EURO|nr:dihydroxyacetone kinase [Penicillium argentinense]KAJ5098778.1 dihydroxyacetone kinase [Penicillium argentinense]